MEITQSASGRVYLPEQRNPRWSKQTASADSDHDRTLSLQVSEELGNLLYIGMDALDLLYRKDSFSSFWFTESDACLDKDCQELLMNPALLRYRKLIRMNAAKFTLACRSLGKPVSSFAVSAAVRFVLLGCFLDNRIDSGQAEEEMDSLRKLDWAYCGPYIEDGIPPKNTSVTDKLMAQTGQFFQYIRSRDDQDYRKCLSLLRRAVESELFTISNKRLSIESVDAEDVQGNRELTGERLAMDKSVLFTALGFFLAISGAATAEDERIFFSVGNVFRIVDDLCDIEEDLQRGHRNSITDMLESKDLPAFYTIYQRNLHDEQSRKNYSPGLSERFIDRVKAQFRELEKELLFLRRTISKPFLDFLYYELRDWTLTNHYIRTKTLH